METDSTTNSTIAIIDKKESLVIEVKDDTKDTFMDSVGFATYSNSRATVLSYSSIFESFWKQLKYEFLYCKIIDDDNNIEPKINEEPTKRGTKGSIYIFADKTRITQVLFNLINNAIKFTTKGIIKIIVEKRYDDEEKVYVNVKDTGSGIDLSIIPHLFSKFATKSKGGMGLGLYISKNIIEAHGGKIWAEEQYKWKRRNIFI